MESDFVSWLTQHLSNASPQVKLGLGDDCAVVHLQGSDHVLAADLLCDGVHFEFAKVTARLIGRKALAVNLSDFAAMAAQPKFALVSLLWPRGTDELLARELYEGMLELAAQHDVAIVGGDTNRWDGKLVVNVALHGTPSGSRVLRRQDARPGDSILISGPLGGSILGHHLTFDPRVAEAIELHREYEIHAAMDVSDGLLVDLNRIIEASHVGAIIDEARVPISDAAHEHSRSTGCTPLEHALSDGEDFELLMTTSPETAVRIEQDQPGGLPWRRIGTITETEGLFAIRDGRQARIEPRGYLH